jgi:hypothetical protein
MRYAALIALLLVSCGKKEPTKSEGPSTSTAASASASASGKAQPKAEPTTVKGSYTAKQAEVRTPEDAPKFIHPESKEGLGAGELEINLPALQGEATGKASGALGAQVFSGFLSDGHLTGTLQPADGASPAMWGVLDATVEGSSVKGTIRASGRDGRVVRDASFTLEKK